MTDYNWERINARCDYCTQADDELRKLWGVLERIAKYEVEPLISHESIWKTMRFMARQVVFPQKHSDDQSGCTGGDDE